MASGILNGSTAHLFTMRGVNILATAGGGIYRVGDALNGYLEELIRGGAPGAPPEGIRAPLEEISRIEAGSSACVPQSAGAGRSLRALCLNVAHSCNMACRYCFAGQGTFGSPAESLMPREVARRAIDLLIEKSAPGALLQVDFFGGEPLLNLETVRDAVDYARREACNAGRSVQFTLTTNGLLLEQDVVAYLNSEGFSVIMSLDGPPEMHDRMRIRPGGAPTYEKVLENVQAFLASRHGKSCYVRGTFTKESLAFCRSVRHMMDLGFTSISMEPVVAEPGKPWALTEEDLPSIEKEYEALACELAKPSRAAVSFFHFQLSLDRPLCAVRRQKNCGAGLEYLAVTPRGDLYPCHQFIGREGFRMGSLDGSPLDERLAARFAGGTVSSKPPCRECWARLYCSGGCFANAHLLRGDMLSPHPMECRMQKKRLECAIWLEVARRAQKRESRQEDMASPALNRDRFISDTAHRQLDSSMEVVDAQVCL